MESSRTITLFSENRGRGQSSAAFLASVLFHGVGLALISFSFLYSPRLDTKAIAERYVVRSIDLSTPEEQRRRVERKQIKYPTSQPKPPSQKPGAGKPNPRPPALREVARAPKGPQTLMQPDLPVQIALTEEVPVPTMVVWAPKQADVKTVVPPQPAKATSAEVKPMPDPPNNALDLSSISIATKPVAAPKLLALPSTTSPIAIHAPERVQMAPSTISQPTQQATPAAIMSLSDLKLADGKVVLPPVNESAAADSAGALAPGTTKEASAAGNSDRAGDAGNGTGTAGATKQPEKPAADNPTPQPATTNPKPAEVAAPPSKGADVNADQNEQATSTQITLPKEGQFGAVVVGESLDAQYPELSSAWGGRLAYTVFLHVGLARSWILQYSLPRLEEASSAGTIARLEAPWPYSIVRPNLTFDAAGGNTIMVHGFVNQSGRFEGLSIVFPPQLPMAVFVLKSLASWQFRPASQNGQPVRVEVLLIIPEQL
jgi:hypothetical protein